MLNSYLLAYTTAASCSLILIQNFNSNPQTQTHEDLRPSPILTLTHTHFLAYSLILPLIMVISLQIVQQVMKKLCKQSIASCSELNLVNITKNSKNIPFLLTFSKKSAQQVPTHTHAQLIQNKLAFLILTHVSTIICWCTSCSWPVSRQMS